MYIAITGVTRGLGFALAKWFIANGHTVAGCGRNGQVIFDLRLDHPSPHLFEVVDVTQPVKVSIWAERVLANGSPDIVINNAALMNDPASLWEISAEKFNQLMAVNINGTANVIRSLVPAMIERKKGVIVNLSSGWGRSVSYGVAPYCASKWAIEGLTQALALELPKGLAAVPLNPGVIDTEMLRQCFGGEAEGHIKAEAWAEIAAPYILKLGAKDNGKSLTVPNAAN